MAYPTCSVCGAENVQSLVRCGKYRAYICEKHCGEGCEYFSGFETSIVHCFFRDKLIEQRKIEAAKRALQEFVDRKNKTSPK